MFFPSIPVNFSIGTKYCRQASVVNVTVPSGLNLQINSVWSLTTDRYRSSLFRNSTSADLRQTAGWTLCASSANRARGSPPFWR